MVSNRERILRALFQNRDGLGHNNLRCEPINIPEKSLRRWIPELAKEKLIKIKKVKGRGGSKHLHTLTKKGLVYVHKNLLSESFLKTFLDLDELTPRNIDVLQSFTQNMLDEMFGKDEVFAYFMSKSQYLTFQDCLKKIRNRTVSWKAIVDNEEK